MNIQELIKEYEGARFAMVAVSSVLEDLKQLDESKKVTVPQFVADWYEKNKDSFDYNLWEYLTDWEEQKPSDFKNWINDEYNTFQTLVNMHQFGYEVEKKKRYKVWLKNSSENTYLAFSIKTNKCFFTSFPAVIYTRETHTREELEDAGFGWVFDCEGIEIEKVEE